MMRELLRRVEMKVMYENHLDAVVRLHYSLPPGKIGLAPQPRPPDDVRGELRMGPFAGVTEVLIPAGYVRTVYDPEIPVNIVDLGLVYDCQVVTAPATGTKVEVKMTLTAPGCGMGPSIAQDARSKIMTIPGVDEADVELVWDPPWNQHMISEAGKMKLGLI